MSQELSEKEITNAFEKLDISPEMESPIKGNSDDLNNALKTMVLDSINKSRAEKKRPDIDSNSDFLSKMVADFLSIDKDSVADFTLQLITLKALVNKKTAIGYDFLCLSNVDNREIEPTPETKSDKIDGDFVKYTTLSSKNRNTIVTQIHKPSPQQEILTFEKFETLLTRHFH